MLNKDNLIEKWYVLHTYSGHEYKVKDRLEERAKRLGVEDQILEVLVPDEEKIEIKGAKRTIVQKKCFPGYVLVKVKVEHYSTRLGTEYKMDSSVWYVIKNTDGIVGFVGDGKHPIPIDNSELESIEKRMVRYNSVPREELEFKVGDKVEITNGSFMGSVGNIQQIDEQHYKLIVMVDIFSRQTPVEVNFEEVRLT